MDATTRGDTTARNTLLSPAGQAKLQTLVGSDQAGALTQSLNQERIRTDHARMLAEVGPLRTVLDRVVLFDEAPLPGEMPRLKVGLDLLVAWFRIGEG